MPGFSPRRLVMLLVSVVTLNPSACIHIPAHVAAEVREMEASVPNHYRRSSGQQREAVDTTPVTMDEDDDRG